MYHNLVILYKLILVESLNDLFIIHFELMGHDKMQKLQ